MTPPRSSLAVLVDGVALPEDDARALWERFSAWMEEHRGDLAGFAAAEGFASIHPGVDGGRPVLLASKTAPQRAYATATAVETRPPGSTGGSAGRHEGRARDRSKRGISKK
ncbi:MAG: hypothetical protein KF764_16885 [Labilithrix sp.]|nr:hypothetical protein [Labilithrix sp.]